MMMSTIACQNVTWRKIKENATKKLCVEAFARECIRFLSIIECGWLVTYLYMLLPMWRKY